MGWSADALKDGRYLDEDRDRELLAEFRRAGEALIRDHGGIDFMFGTGALHLGQCKLALARATGRKVDGETWTPAEVCEAYRSATWVEPDGAGDRMAFWNVRVFLETCCRLGLGLELNL
jgi:hypothetical protein